MASGFLGAIGKQVGKREKQRLQKKYSGSSASGDSGGSSSGGGVADIVRQAVRRKRGGKSRS